MNEFGSYFRTSRSESQDCLETLEPDNLGNISKRRYRIGRICNGAKREFYERYIVCFITFCVRVIDQLSCAGRHFG